jgi:hypothetical protein
MDKKKLRRAPLVIALAAVFPVMLGACNSPGSFSSDPSSQSGVGAGTLSTQQAGVAQFAQCMRQNGVTNFPDPQPDGAIVAPPQSVRNTAAYQTAFNECKSKLPGGGSGLQG